MEPTTQTLSPNTGAPWFGDIADQPAEIRDWITTKNFADPKTALISQFNLEKTLGHDRAGRTIVLPKDDNDAEGVKAFRTKLGVPEKADGYALPETMKDDPIGGTYQAAAHELGLTPKQFSGLTERMFKAAAEIEIKNQQARDNANKQGIAALQGEWGAQFDAKREAAKRAAIAGTKGMDAETAKLFSDAVETDPRFLRIFAAFGDLIKEHSFAGGDPGTGGESISLAQAQERMDALQKERAEGKVGDAEYWKRKDVLDKILSRGA